MLIILAGLLVAWALRNDTLHAVDRDDIHAELESIVSKSDPAGNVEYSDVVDQGCDSGNSVGLDLWTHCAISGRRFYRSQGTPSVDLRPLDQALIANGWKRSLKTGQTPADFDQILTTPAEDGLALYERGSIPLVVSQHIYEGNNPSRHDEVIDALIKNGALSTPASSESILRVDISVMYWSCHASILKLPCPAPPSKPQ
ncbi:hypothetical protein ACFCV3_00955 [Kribbella sp. NPDC056345]|uniref:hypothetical protein n=1 Tax=Kribbella sp. NPDC056345 TaxID=3345789 RepID=UPI0035E03753